MTKEKYNALRRYTAVMLQAEKMLKQGLISKEEYGIIDTKTAEKTGLSSGSIFLENRLIYSDIRGNM